MYIYIYIHIYICYCGRSDCARLLWAVADREEVQAGYGLNVTIEILITTIVTIVIIVIIVMIVIATIAIVIISMLVTIDGRCPYTRSP